MKTRRFTRDEVISVFAQDDAGDVFDALIAWAKMRQDYGRHSDKYLIDRLEYILNFIDTTPVEFEEEAYPDTDGPWEAA